MQNTNLTFNDLPTAVSKLSKEISELKRLLVEQSQNQPTEQPDQLLTIQEISELLHLSVPTIYSKHSKGEIPGVCKRGKRLYFQRDVIVKWIKDGRKKTQAELEAEAETYLLNSKNTKK